MTSDKPFRNPANQQQARTRNSVSRALGDAVVHAILATIPYVNVVQRELVKGLPSIDPDWVAETFTDAEARSPEQPAAS